MEYYTYVYLDPRKPGVYKYSDIEFTHEPFYIGRGKENRLNDHVYRASIHKGHSSSRKLNRIRGLLYENLEPLILTINKDLSYEESIDLEIDLIVLIGRKDINNGPLLNLTDGGEGMRNYKHSEETKKLLSNASTGDKNYRHIHGLPKSLYGKFAGWNKGKTLSNEHKESLSIALTGRVISDEVRLNMSEGQKGRVFSKESKRRISDSLSGKVCGDPKKKTESRVFRTIDELVRLGLEFTESNFNNSRPTVGKGGCLLYNTALKHFSRDQMLERFNSTVSA